MTDISSALDRCSGHRRERTGWSVIVAPLSVHYLMGIVEISLLA